MMLPEFAGFFENAAQQRLAFPYCRRCANFHWYPMPRCPQCRSRDIIWRSIEGRGELVSFSHVMHAFDKSRSDALPYVVALVKFADAPGVNLITNIDAPAMDTLQVGDAVVPVFHNDNGGRPMVEFRLA